MRTAPNILVLHLKRFDYSYIGKLSHFLMYPETLSGKSFISELESNEKVLNAHFSFYSLSFDYFLFKKTLRNINYKLYGVLVHTGSTSHSGHYYSYVRSPNNVWFKADDSRVS
jgi:ubiquitin C-terminal hydrolase